MKIQLGFMAKDRDVAAALYWEAFGEKLGLTMGPKVKALAYLDRVMRADHAISAYDDTDQLLGLVGFKTSKGALVGGAFRDMSAVYGLIGTSWRAALLTLLERDVENQRFLMDGIFVTDHARGQGVGSRLLDAIKAQAFDRGYKTVRLDVIDSNTRAKALYLRHGFREVDTQHLGPLRFFFGFKSATTMVADARPSAHGTVQPS